MSVRIFRSSDPGSPALSGLPGSLLEVFDACLVNGYGSTPSLGWSRLQDPSWVGLYLAAYRQASGTRCYLKVSDDGSCSTGSRDARVRGFTELTAIPYPTFGYDILDDPNRAMFPTVDQAPISVISKSSTSIGKTIPWIIIGNSSLFYLLTNYNSYSVSKWKGFVFGDIAPLVSTDKKCCFILVHTTEDSDSRPEMLNRYEISSVDPDTTIRMTGQYLSHDVITGATSCYAYKYADGGRQGTYTSGNKSSPLGDTSPRTPSVNAVSGGISLHRTIVGQHTTGLPRGTLPGLYSIDLSSPFASGQVVSCIDQGVTKIFESISLDYSSDATPIMIETSNTWEMPDVQSM